MDLRQLQVLRSCWGKWKLLLRHHSSPAWHATLTSLPGSICQEMQIYWWQIWHDMTVSCKPQLSEPFLALHAHLLPICFSSVSCWKLLALSWALPHLEALPGTWESVVRMVLAVSATKVPLANLQHNRKSNRTSMEGGAKRWNIRSYSDYSLNFIDFHDICRNNSISCSSCGHGSSVGLRHFETVKCDQAWRHRSVPQSSAEGGGSATAAQDWDVDEIGCNIVLQHTATCCIILHFDVFCPICGLRNAEKTFEVCGQIQRCGSRCQSVLFAFFCSFFCWFVFLVYSCYALKPLATMSMCHHVPRQMPLGGILVVYDGQVRWSLLQIQEAKIVPTKPPRSNCRSTTTGTSAVLLAYNARAMAGSLGQNRMQTNEVDMCGLVI